MSHMEKPETSILLRCLLGTASPEEASMLDTWLTASPDNRREFDALWKKWQMTTDKANYKAPDLVKDWQELSARISLPPSSPPPSSFQPGWAGIGKIVSFIAAAGIIMGIVINSKRSSPQKDPASPRIIRQSGASVLKDTLSDHTIVTMDNQSVLSYPAKGAQGNMVLLAGKVFLQAPEQKGKPVTAGIGPLMVQSNGGNFLLAFDTTSGIISIQVTKGALKILEPHKEGLAAKDPAGMYVVQGGQMIRYNMSTHQITKKDSLPPNDIAFATGIFSFHNTSLTELTAVLAKAYGISIKLGNTAIGNCRMTAQFDNLPIKNVLDIVATTLNITYSIQQGGKLIMVTGQGCE